ncbi:hypothetical protein ASPZODRAFT_795985 [Penicilliopsis zonata CBS 506.65]|uniref:Ubiquitin-like domain-containing protein n=1 Tax=Penicilliopsis zonata CBS 506.65 TaxID=1073090 RepID=A0A1L9SBH8_9EURO|nr:hypothetical protein ASPZODRAFT_795985 [Penicilliopsis zonata CBS 506.65]OJJ44496.1 hypothetical protein ASPZODRAFT_795985 [Penicilliopsis zonata CBS 506.65]
MNDHTWRNHLKHDLDAYVCLFEGCAKGDVLYSYSEEWLNHMREHKVRWRCTAKAHGILIFKDKVDYLDHILSKHKGAESHLDSLTDPGSQPSSSLFVTCPLCNAEAATLNIPLEDHIASHLRYLALKSLPFVDCDDQSPGTNLSVQSSGGDIGSRSTLDDDSDRGLSLDFGNEHDQPSSPDHDEELHLSSLARSEGEETFSDREDSASLQRADPIITKAAEETREERILREQKENLEDLNAINNPKILQKLAAEAAQTEAIITQTETKIAAENATDEGAEALAAANPPLPEKKKLIKFTDAVGRRLSLPFHLCCTWEVKLVFLWYDSHHD